MPDLKKTIKEMDFITSVFFDSLLLLKEREPVKPIRGGSGDGSKVWYLCGKCKNCVDTKDGVKYNYCPFCGTQVDWE